MWSILIEKKIIHIHYHDLYEIYNFGRPFLGNHYYILGLSDLCLGVEKNILKEIMHSLHDLNDHAPKQEALPQGSLNLQFQLTLPYSWLLHTWGVWYIPGSREEKYSNFTLFTKKLPPLQVGIIKLTNSCLLTVQMPHTKFG